MQTPTNIKPPEKLKAHYEKFQRDLSSLPAELKAKYEKLQNKLASDLALTVLEKEPLKADQFYGCFAQFVEDSNFVKMLYQVLLEEYYFLDIFNKHEYDGLKAEAARKIEVLIRQDRWFDRANGENRAQFRFEMLVEIRKKVHEKSLERRKKGERIAALCLSGGGIRSATFGLGVLQGLAKHDLLSKFDYLSTVSGGGYIGSWLSAWIHRIVKDDCEICREKADLPPVKARKPIIFNNDSARLIEKKLVTQTADLPEPPELTHLRSYSNYMSPRTGLFSADTWTLGAVYLRNLLLNWTVFVPLIAAFLLLPKIYVTVLGLQPEKYWQFFVFSIAIIFGIGGVVNINAMRPSLKKYSWVDQTYGKDDIGMLKSVEAKVIKWVLAWILMLAFGITTFWAWNRGVWNFPFSQWIGGKLDFDVRLIDFIVFSEILFLGGYLLAWAAMFPKFIAENRKNSTKVNNLRDKLKRFYRHYLAEVCVSLVCGTFGGALLFLVVKNLKYLNEGFYRLVGKEESLNNLPTVTPEFLVCFGAPLFLLIFLLTATLFVGFAVRFTNDEDREWVARFGAWILMVIAGWSVISTAVIFGSEIFTFDWKGGLLAAVGGVSGLITLILGFSDKSAAKIEDAEPKNKKSFLAWFAPAVAAPIFVLFLVILISYLTELLVKKVVIFDNFKHLTWFAILSLIGIVMGFFININKFSFHSIYRERLIRAYLGASRTKERLFSANSFTGLDSENDNLEMRCLKQKPFHVVNMTLNLVKTQNLRWQNRKSESFTATALYCGSSNMGENSGNYRSSEVYGLNAQNGRAITLGTAAAISGAAASPNMGYYTMNSAVSFLMVLFNVRLGWWLGNPGRRGADTFNLPAPRWSPRLFLDESIGGTDDSKPYVYLSDGGHFDNLGLYEMVLRRCHLIVVSDAGCDADFGFSDFGTAIHKIRVDMGIPIEFEREKHPAKTRNCGIGKIRYSCVDENAEDGILLYLKPTLDGDEPIDLKNYKKENPDFPHESTADQMYSESQFESYRSLGFHQINSICCRQDSCGCLNLSHLERNAERYLRMFQNKEKRKNRRSL